MSVGKRRNEAKGRHCDATQLLLQFKGGRSGEQSRALEKGFLCLLAVGTSKININYASGAGVQHGAAMSGDSKS